MSEWHNRSMDVITWTSLGRLKQKVWSDQRIMVMIGSCTRTLSVWGREEKSHVSFHGGPSGFFEWLLWVVWKLEASPKCRTLADSVGKEMFHCLVTWRRILWSSWSRGVIQVLVFYYSSLVSFLLCYDNSSWQLLTLPLQVSLMLPHVRVDSLYKFL